MTATMIGEDEIRALIPHAGRMCFWQTVTDWDEAGIRCVTNTHRDPAHPLRRDGQLSAIHLAEYGAQAMAIHGGLLARRDSGGKAAPGMLASLRDFEMQVQRVDDVDTALTVHARKLVAGAGGAIYEFEISAGSRKLASGRVSVIPMGVAAA
ncbi:MAG: phosphotransferase [Stenotrophobium sp.]